MKVGRRLKMKRMKRMSITLGATIALALGGCSSAPLVVNFATGEISGQNGDSFNGVVLGNNSPYTVNVLAFGPVGLEAALFNFPPGGSYTIFGSYFPYYQSIVIKANAFWKGNFIGQATRIFAFYVYGGGYGGSYSYLREWTFQAADFRSALGVIDRSMGPIERGAMSILATPP